MNYKHKNINVFTQKHALKFLGMYSTGNGPAGGRPARAQSASSDNIALKIAAKNASIHRRQDASRDDTDTESEYALKSHYSYTAFLNGSLLYYFHCSILYDSVMRSRFHGPNFYFNHFPQFLFSSNRIFNIFY